MPSKTGARLPAYLYIQSNVNALNAMISFTAFCFCTKLSQIYYGQVYYKEQKYDQMNYKWQKNLPNVRFTYNNSQNYNQSLLRTKPYQILESGRHRAESLPPQKADFLNKAKTTSHIKIIQDVSFNERKRKHRIFQDSPLVKLDSTSKSRRRNQTIFGENKRNSLQKTPQKETQQKKIQTQNDEEVIHGKKVTDHHQQSGKKDKEAQELDTNQLHRYIDNKLTQKLRSIHLKKGDENFKQSLNNQQIMQKEQQINYLRLQVQRLKRCQKLNKQNQYIYKKLVSNLKEHYKNPKGQRSSKNSSPVKSSSKLDSPQKYKDIQTPINSLCELKKVERQNQQQSIFGKNELQNNDRVFLGPQHIILSPQELLVQNGKIEYTQSVNQKKRFKEVTFNNTKQMGSIKKHSRREIIQLLPSMLQIKQQILYNQSSKQAFSQLQTGNRLQYINNQLQRKLSRRSSSRPNKDQSINSNSVKTTSNYRTNQKFLY